MKAKFKIFSAIFLCILVLGIQGGFYHIHEHSLEVLSHKCVHDGEHDQTLNEECSVCEFLADVQYDVTTPLYLTTTEDNQEFYQIELTRVFSNPCFELNNRGPPSIS